MRLMNVNWKTINFRYNITARSADYTQQRKDYVLITSPLVQRLAIVRTEIPKLQSLFSVKEYINGNSIGKFN